MKKALIISAVGRQTFIIEHILRSTGYSVFQYIRSGSELRRNLSLIRTGLVVINTPLPDEFGIELAVKTAESADAGIILVCREEIADDAAEKTSHLSVAVASSPITRDNFLRTLKRLETMRSIMQGTQRENVSLMAKIDEMRLISRAKCTLMEYLRFTEPQAHKYIEKQAMNNRLTRREVALKILASYKK